jgi:hypothetical protein
MSTSPSSILETLRARQRATRPVDLPGVVVPTAVRLLSVQELRHAREEAIRAVDALGVNRQTGGNGDLVADEAIDFILVRAWVVDADDRGDGPGEKRPVCANVKELREHTDQAVREVLAQTYSALQEDLDPRRLDDAVLAQMIEEVKKKPSTIWALSNGNWLRRLAHGLAVQLATWSGGSGSNSSASPSPTSSGAATATPT